MKTPHENVTRPKASFVASMKTVLWSFVGIRKGRDYQRDVEQLNPIQIVIAAVIGVAIFITILIIIIQTVVGP